MLKSCYISLKIKNLIYFPMVVKMVTYIDVIQGNQTHSADWKTSKAEVSASQREADHRSPTSVFSSW